MSKIENEKIVQQQLEAYNRRDIDAFCRCFHPEVKTYSLLTGELRIDGAEAFRTGYTPLFRENPNLHCEIKNRTVLNDSILDEEWVTGAANYPNGLHAVAIYAFRDGLIDRVWFTR